MYTIQNVGDESCSDCSNGGKTKDPWPQTWGLCQTSDNKYYAIPDNGSNYGSFNALIDANNQIFPQGVPDISICSQFPCDQVSDYPNCKDCVNTASNNGSKICNDSVENYSLPWTNASEYTTLNSTWKTQKNYQL